MRQYLHGVKSECTCNLTARRCTLSVRELPAPYSLDYQGGSKPPEEPKFSPEPKLEESYLCAIQQRRNFANSNIRYRQRQCYKGTLIIYGLVRAITFNHDYSDVGHVPYIDVFLFYAREMTTKNCQPCSRKGSACPTFDQA